MSAADPARNDPADAPTRGRGRPRSGDDGDTRSAIVAAARSRFAADGFAGSTLRGIAADAGVDASLIRHYFGGKDGLFVATLQLPIDPLALISGALTGDRDGLGPRVVATFVNAWDPHADVFSTLLRTATASADAGAPLLEMLRGVLLPMLTAVVGEPDGELRAALMVGELLGLATLRYVLRVDPVAHAAPADVVRWYGPTLQRLVTPG